MRNSCFASPQNPACLHARANCSSFTQPLPRTSMPLSHAIKRLPYFSVSLVLSSESKVSVSSSKSRKRMYPCAFPSSSCQRPFRSPENPKRSMAMVNSLKVRRPVPSRSRARRQAPSSEPQRLTSIRLKPSKVVARNMLFTPVICLAFALSRSCNCARHFRAPSLTGCSWMSRGIEPMSPSPGTSSRNSTFAFDVRPWKSDVVHLLHASGSNCSKVMPLSLGPLRSMLNSLLLSKAWRPRRWQHALISFSSIRPVPFVSIPLRHAVSMSPYSSINATLNVAA
mmetsp:Transcript_46594/g.148771  ORF Transcript_46594/g.148771 Transcript_46594/m.148771 type:complete len:282 (-) Transcript_46594:393-1238(-)